jgi:hypothetical protein
MEILGKTSLQYFQNHMLLTPKIFNKMIKKDELILKFQLNTWFGLISYLYFLANILAIEILMANETIAKLIESPKISETSENDGSSGGGIPGLTEPTVGIFQFSLNWNKYENKVPKITLVIMNSF